MEFKGIFRGIEEGNVAIEKQKDQIVRLKEQVADFLRKPPSRVPSAKSLSAMRSQTPSTIQEIQTRLQKQTPGTLTSRVYTGSHGGLVRSNSNINRTQQTQHQNSNFIQESVNKDLNDDLFYPRLEHKYSPRRQSILEFESTIKQELQIKRTNKIYQSKSQASLFKLQSRQGSSKRNLRMGNRFQTPQGNRRIPEKQQHKTRVNKVPEHLKFDNNVKFLQPTLKDSMYQRKAASYLPHVHQTDKIIKNIQRQTFEREKTIPQLLAQDLQKIQKAQHQQRQDAMRTYKNSGQKHQSLNKFMKGKGVVQNHPLKRSVSTMRQGRSLSQLKFPNIPTNSQSLRVTIEKSKSSRKLNIL